MGELHIPKVPRYGVVIEKYNEIKNSLFYEIYNDAIKNVTDIIEGQKSLEKELFFNPCIAFVGKRGTGKSSAMGSFANLLKEINTNSNEWIKDDKTKDIISKSKFYVLPAIDTANMSKKETILSTVSSEMFNVYNEKSKDILVENKRKFIESTMKVNNTALLKSSGDWTKQGDNLLVETDKVVHLKKLFEDMVKDYLTIIENNSSSDNCYLVIQLDDLDMNIFNSFSIMEEIRNVLSIKNIIVLLSVDIEQLKTVLTINFSESLQPKYNKSVEKSADKTSTDLAYKYIEKLIPFNRRHYMPELSSKQLKTHYSKNFLGDDDENWHKMELVSTEGETPTIINAVMHLIWRKTMMIPMCNENEEYILLPRNLRSLCNFVVFLRNMKDVAIVPNDSNKNGIVSLTYFDFANNETYRTNLDHNLRDFYKYIISNLEVYKAPEMNDEDEELSNTLITLIQTLSDADLAECNRKITSDILYNLKDKCKNYYEHINQNETLDSINIATSYSDTVSLGDVLYLLGKIDKTTNCNYIRYLVQVIRTLWSIKMTAEIYVNGCNPQKDELLDTQSKFITTAFRNTVGAMIINPDTSESFLHSSKSANHDWMLRNNKDDDSDNKRSIYDVIIQKDNIDISIVDTDEFSQYHWRVHLRTGEPIYKGHYMKDEHYLLSHPMLLFSNLLNPKILETDMDYNLEHDAHIYTDWQSKYIMSLPFYSMDYMYRLYIAFRRKVKAGTSFDVQPIVNNVLENVMQASNDLYIEIKKYIPPIESSYKISDETKNIPASELIFIEPLKHLQSITDWNKELLLINKKFIALLDDTKNKIEKVIAYNNSHDKEDEYEITRQWNSMLNYLSNYFPNKFVDNNYSTLYSSEIGYDEKIEELQRLIDDLNGKGDIKSHYYYKEIDNSPFEDIPTIQDNL